MENENTKQYPVSGDTASGEETACPDCESTAVTVMEPEPEPESAEPTITEQKKSGKKSKTPLLLAAVVILAAVGVMWQINDTKLKQYADTMAQTAYSMMTGTDEANSCGSLIVQVWQNAIYHTENDTTDPYTRPDGQFVEDFNDALRNLLTDFEFSARQALLAENRATVQSGMRELKDPPSKYREEYAALCDLYDDYIAVVNLALNPQGSLTSYSEEYHAASKAAYESCVRINLYFG